MVSQASDGWTTHHFAAMIGHAWVFKGLLRATPFHPHSLYPSIPASKEREQTRRGEAVRQGGGADQGWWTSSSALKVLSTAFSGTTC